MQSCCMEDEHESTFEPIGRAAKRVLETVQIARFEPLDVQNILKDFDLMVGGQTNELPLQNRSGKLRRSSKA